MLKTKEKPRAKDRTSETVDTPTTSSSLNSLGILAGMIVGGAAAVAMTSPAPVNPNPYAHIKTPDSVKWFSIRPRLQDTLNMAIDFIKDPCGMPDYTAKLMENRWTIRVLDNGNINISYNEKSREDWIKHLVYYKWNEQDATQMVDWAYALYEIHKNTEVLSV